MDLYNDFITSHRGYLDANAYVLKGHFMRETGVDAGQSAYDRFATSLANRYSAELDGVEFCATVDEMVRIAADASPQELLRMAEAVAEAPDSGRCGPSNYRFEAADAERGDPDYARRHSPPAPPRIAIVEQAPAVAAMRAAPAAPAVAVVAAATAVEPAAPAEAKQALVEKAVAAAPAPAAASPAREEALQTAITALQSAITALQAASTPAAPANLPLEKVEHAPIVPPQDGEQD